MIEGYRYLRRTLRGKAISTEPRFRSFHSAADTKLVRNLAKCWRCSRGSLRYCLPSELGIEEVMFECYTVLPSELSIEEILIECYIRLPSELDVEEVLFECYIRPPCELGIGEVLFKVSVI